MKSAYWLQNALSNFVYPRYSQLFPELQRTRDALDAEFETLVAATDAEAKGMSEADARRHLTDVTLSAASTMMQRWRELAMRIIVKYNDMTEKPERNGQYLKTAGGDQVPVIRPGYPERYRRLIVEKTGNRYRKP